jgi:hypothetical protein
MESRSHLLCLLITTALRLFNCIKAMIAFSDHDHWSEQWISSGWNLCEDDCPRPPELSLLDSAQKKRWVKSQSRQPAGVSVQPAR